MAQQKKKNFDVPVSGVSSRYISMEDLIRSFEAHKMQDPETARAMAEYACDSGNLSAKLVYGKFLRTTVNLNMSQAERYEKAEQLLLSLLNLLDIPDWLSASAAMELGTLYAECLNRPVGALAMFLYAKRHGADVSDGMLNQLQRQMRKADINRMGSNSRDSLMLGLELFYANESPRNTEWFLREAADKAEEEMRAGDPRAENLYAQACLALGDFYDLHLGESASYSQERDKMYARAKQYGFPIYLERSAASGKKARGSARFQ